MASHGYGDASSEYGGLRALLLIYRLLAQSQTLICTTASLVAKSYTSQRSYCSQWSAQLPAICSQINSDNALLFPGDLGLETGLFCNMNGCSISTLISRLDAQLNIRLLNLFFIELPHRESHALQICLPNLLPADFAHQPVQPVLVTEQHLVWLLLAPLLEDLHAH